jgi:DNA helicase-2/ATP-dependent DNA helicase PcrA
MNRSELTPQQRAVVEATEPVRLVLGGAGTGKTTVALWAARAALEAAGAPWHRVLFLTFSRTAVTQLITRAHGVLADIGHRVEVATFHGFAYRLLRDFGRYAGWGDRSLEVASVAQIKLLGDDGTRLRYDDLVPAAQTLLDIPAVRELVVQRWPVVICDEFQDTSTEQWELLNQFGEHARLILLADPNQMIYSYVPGVGPERLTAARELADRIIELEPVSHRDPTGAIPALAEAIRCRQFTHEAVAHAHATKRLRVYADVDDDEVADIIRSELADARAGGSQSFGIFGHSNQGVATLGHDLTEAGIPHALIGIPEAEGEALAALGTLVGFALRHRSEGELRIALATFLTACTRGPVPNLAIDLVNNADLTRGLAQRLAALQEALLDANDFMTAVEVAAGGWGGLDITHGNRPWRQAAAQFAARARQFARIPGAAGTELLGLLDRSVAQMRRGTLIGDRSARPAAVQLMNFHQTKGREADAVVLVYRHGDYLANRYATEPFEDASRVLYVSLTRARHSIAVILPPDPHPLVEPFAAWS